MDGLGTQSRSERVIPLIHPPPALGFAHATNGFLIRALWMAGRAGQDML